MTDWFATAVGIVGGLTLSYVVGKRVLLLLAERSMRPGLLIKLSFGGAVVAVLPALLLSILVGAPLGVHWGAAGLVLGVALVFALILLAGTFAGAVLAKLVTRPGA